jgi:hypothetical protein
MCQSEMKRRSTEVQIDCRFYIYVCRSFQRTTMKIRAHYPQNVNQPRFVCCFTRKCMDAHIVYKYDWVATSITKAIIVQHYRYVFWMCVWVWVCPSRFSCVRRINDGAQQILKASNVDVIVVYKSNNPSIHPNYFSRRAFFSVCRFFYCWWRLWTDYFIHTYNMCPGLIARSRTATSHKNLDHSI